MSPLVLSFFGFFPLSLFTQGPRVRWWSLMSGCALNVVGGRNTVGCKNILRLLNTVSQQRLASDKTCWKCQKCLQNSETCRVTLPMDFMHAVLVVLFLCSKYRWFSRTLCCKLSERNLISCVVQIVWCQIACLCVVLYEGDHVHTLYLWLKVAQVLHENTLSPFHFHLSCLVFWSFLNQFHN